jgi:uncharacterized protein involved in exopolysaccharide biosynthesis
MAKIVTNRDRLDRLVDYFRKATRYWWLIGGIVVLGGTLAMLVAQSRPRKYQSWSVVFYQERIQSSVLRGSSGGDASPRSIGDRYRELLTSQSLLLNIVHDPKLNPFPELLAKQGPDAAVEALRLATAFQSRGNSVFHVTFTDEDPVRAQAVAARLTDLLNEKDDTLRASIAQRSAKFTEEQKRAAEVTLTARNKALTEFLYQHPEFSQETAQSNVGVSIAANQNRPAAPGNSRLATLDRQRQRILARLNAKPGTQVTVIEPATASPERQAAQAALNEAKRDLANAKRELETALTNYTDIHPAAVKARDKVTAMEAKVAQAEKAVPADPVVTLPPSTPEDRAALQRELKSLEDQIAATRTEDRGKTPSSQSDEATHIIELEAQHDQLRRAWTEQSSQVKLLEDAVFAARIEADRQVAEQGGRLSIVDPAFRPTKPQGAGKSVFVLAGLVVFGAIGGTLALGLALIDDRLYRRDDIDELGIPVLAVIPSARAQAAPRRARAAKPTKKAPPS